VVETKAPVEATATSVETQSQATKQYSNPAFGIGFLFPDSWYGPEEYISGDTLLVNIGSDVVYPYGEVPEKPSEIKNSYLVTVQFDRNSQNTNWQETYSALREMKDGDSLDTGRSRTIRVRKLELGKYTGFESIATLSETAQTDHVYIRIVILVNDQSNVLIIMGQPNNVEVGNSENWRDVYQSIDDANLDLFHGIIDSLKVD
jgi:hypothetical protein